MIDDGLKPAGRVRFHVTEEGDCPNVHATETPRQSAIAARQNDRRAFIDSPYLDVNGKE